MRVLYVVFWVCLLALLWAAWAIARTIRGHGSGNPASAADRLSIKAPPAEPDDEARN